MKKTLLILSAPRKFAERHSLTIIVALQLTTSTFAAQPSEVKWEFHAAGAIAGTRQDTCRTRQYGIRDCRRIITSHYPRGQ